MVVDPPLEINGLNLSVVLANFVRVDTEKTSVIVSDPIKPTFCLYL